MAIVDPQLSPQGWGTSTKQIVDNTLARFFVSEGNQSTTFRGRIASMSDLVAKYGNNPSALTQETKIALERLFSRIVDVVEVTVIEIPLTPGGTKYEGRYGIEITVEVVINGERRNLLETLDIGDTTFKRVTEYMNHGG